ncbi:hypothetical protein VTN77DRAFT_6233 [Rasamsonia byssochlamydoides]|uniref:uncharacterized protein n=1 Tax=Rasamsonia byssochlamydoides TaxID=89139 RepID=UPI003743136C
MVFSSKLRPNSFIKHSCKRRPGPPQPQNCASSVSSSDKEPGEDRPPFCSPLGRGSGRKGFLGYRCAAYGDEERWQLFLSRLDCLIEESWQDLDRECCEEGSFSAVVRDATEIRWVEDPTLQGQGVEEVKRRFNILQRKIPQGSPDSDDFDDKKLAELYNKPWWERDLPIPFDLHDQICVMVDESSLESVIESPTHKHFIYRAERYDIHMEEMPLPPELQTRAAHAKEIGYLDQFRMLYQKKHLRGYLIAIDGDWEDDGDDDHEYEAEYVADARTARADGDMDFARGLNAEVCAQDIFNAFGGSVWEYYDLSFEEIFEDGRGNVEDEMLLCDQ